MKIQRLTIDIAYIDDVDFNEFVEKLKEGNVIDATLVQYEKLYDNGSLFNAEPKSPCEPKSPWNDIAISTSPTPLRVPNNETRIMYTNEKNKEV